MAHKSGFEEKWEQWRPIAGLANQYSFHSLSDNEDSGFKVTFKANTKKLIVFHFKNWVHSYRYIEELFALRKLDELTAQYGETFINWPFFEVHNSSYLEWLSRESWGLSDDRNLRHYCFLTTDSILEIVDDTYPEIYHLE